MRDVNIYAIASKILQVLYGNAKIVQLIVKIYKNYLCKYWTQLLLFWLDDINALNKSTLSLF